MLQSTFTHKILMTVFAGFAAASVLWMFRHVVKEAFDESSDDGWRKSLYGQTGQPVQRHR